MLSNKVYVIVNGAHGKVITKSGVSFGPTCNWTITITKAAMNGFRGAAIRLYNAAGTEFQQVTASNSSVQSFPIELKWKGLVKEIVATDTLLYINLEDGTYDGSMLTFCQSYPIYDHQVKARVELQDVKALEAL